MPAHSDFDSAWKDALDAYFPQFMALLWPTQHAQIDWRCAPVFLGNWGFSRENIVRLFRIIDAMVGLPEALEPVFEGAVIQIEEERQMTYVTSIERVRLKREREQGIQQGVQQGQHETAVKVLA